LKKATIDTNIFVSGLLFGGIPLKILERALRKDFSLVTSTPLMAEIERVLSSKKFKLTETEIFALVGPLFEVAQVVVPEEEITVISRCPADNRVLECAVTGRCTVIVTGDRRDLVSLKVFRGIPIVTPRAFYETI
jgi:putative PIN family toxin of toxin-antitoxin system